MAMPALCFGAHSLAGRDILVGMEAREGRGNERTELEREGASEVDRRSRVRHGQRAFHAVTAHVGRRTGGPATQEVRPRADRTRRRTTVPESPRGR